MSAIEFDPDKSGGYKKSCHNKQNKNNKGNTPVLNKKRGASTNINNDLSMFNEVTGRCVPGIGYPPSLNHTTTL